MGSIKPVCAVVGVGPGIGGAIARQFSRNGYALALIARRTDYSTALAAEIGDGARAYSCDVADPEAIARTFAAIGKDLGNVAVVAYNAGSGVWGTVDDVDVEAMTTAWRINTLGLFATARAVAPAMKAEGQGAIVVTGATASLRGGAGTAAFASAKAAQRSLVQSMARHWWPQGIHVALIVVDGVVDLPRTRESMRDKPDEFFVKPEHVAETAWWLSQQPRSAWSFEVEARPFGEKW
jgi:NAD(P)-dependent dehydrogenase (short-subunit alcohol dehydrogenase family)